MSSSMGSTQKDDASTSLTPTTKSQRIPKPKISADFIYQQKPQRRSTTAKRKLLEKDDETLNGSVVQNGSETKKKKDEIVVVNNSKNGKSKVMKEESVEEKSSKKDQSPTKSINSPAKNVMWMPPKTEVQKTNLSEVKLPSKSPPLVGEKKSNGYLHRSSNGYLKEAINEIGNAKDHNNQQQPILKSPFKTQPNYFTLPSKILKQQDDDAVSDYLPDEQECNEWSQNDETMNSTFYNEEDSLNDEFLTQKGKDKRPTLMTHILRALSEHPDGKSNLTDIYEYIKNSSDRYKTMKTEWRSSVRNCLSSSRRFMKFPRPITSFKARGALWGLNPDHPANAQLLNCPKDPSKFVCYDPQTPVLSSKKSRRFEYPTPCESPFDNTSLNDGSNSNLSAEDVYIRRATWTPGRHQSMQQIRIAIMPPNQNEYSNGDGEFGRNTNLAQEFQTNGQDFDQNPVQYVYYYPKQETETQSSTYKALESTTENSVVYTTPSTNSTYPSASTQNQHPNLSRLLSGPSTPIVNDSTLVETKNYISYTYEEHVSEPPQQNYYSNGFPYENEEYDQENLLPKPLMPTGIDEKEFAENRMNSIYMQL